MILYINYYILVFSWIIDFCIISVFTQNSINYTSDIEFYLYTLANPGTPQKLIVDDLHNLRSSNFSPNRLTKIIIHGWIADYRSVSVRPIKQAYLATGDHNIILVDWKPLANLNYIAARSHVLHIGNYVGLLINFLIENGKANANDIHLLGHSLGAHIAGNAARNSHYHIARITGLDPALPLFNHKVSDALNANDARFVDIIHTDGGQLGILKPMGQVDFFPNGGKPPQPGCAPYDLISSGTCSHMRAPYYFAETIMNPKCMLGIQCDNMVNFMAGKCNNNPTVYMGENCPSGANGTYYFQTRNLAPFGMGKVTRPHAILD